jgi:hypothetical protein
LSWARWRLWWMVDNGGAHGRAEERERERGREHGSRKRQGTSEGEAGGSWLRSAKVTTTTTAGQGGVGKYHSWQPLLASLLQHFSALNLPLPPPTRFVLFIVATNPLSSATAPAYTLHTTLSLSLSLSHCREESKAIRFRVLSFIAAFSFFVGLFFPSFILWHYYCAELLVS